MASPHTIVGLGGTFDHFHSGHQKFIDFAAQVGDTLLIGVTTRKMTLGKPYAATIQSIGKRFRAVQQYCQDQGYQFELIKLEDELGPTIEQGKVHRLAVTTETQDGAQHINTIRDKLNLRPLPVHVCQLATDQAGDDLHSAAIRAGTVDAAGTRYDVLLQDEIKLDQSQRQFFSKPQGKLVTTPRYVDLDQEHLNHPVIAVVGDVTLLEFLNHDWPFDIAAYDLQSKRESLGQVASQLLADLPADATLTNPPGNIDAAMSQHLIEYLQSTQLGRDADHYPAAPHLIKIDGEEDLVVVALTLLLPLYSLVYYGQPDQGMVEITVTPKKKAQFAHYLYAS